MSAERFNAQRGQEQGPQGRKWLGIYFRCCRVYGRLYRDEARGCYSGHCPRCASPVNVPIGDGGTNRRFFEAE